MNIHSYNLVSNLRHLRANDRIRGRCETIHQIDSIKHFDEFVAAVHEFKVESSRSGDPLMWHGIANESLFYGHLRVLSEYAGRDYDERDRFLLPAIEHGIAWLTNKNVSLERPYVHNTVSQGAYRKSLSYELGIPHYAIGPYVCYADSWYDDALTERLHCDFGKTALIFPAHSYEGSSVSYEKGKFVSRIMDELSSGFDTVLVSAYWHDADDELFTLFSEAGAKIVSAGIRSDPAFISRLKTMIRLSDVVVGNALGTHIGYALAEGKSFVMTDWDSPEIDDYASGYSKDQLNGIEAVDLRVKKAFSPNRPDRLEQECIFDTYWGGRGSVRSPEEISAMFGVSRDILHASKGFTNKFASIAADCLIQYKKSPSHIDQMKYELLRDALGKE